MHRNRTDRPTTPERAARRRIGSTTAAAAALITGITSLPGAADATPVRAVAANRPAATPHTAWVGTGPEFQGIGFGAESGRAESGRAESADSTATLPARGTRPFSMLGVSWADPSRAVGGAIQVRARALGTGRWGAWRTLESDGADPGDARGATDPAWVGESDGVQARVAGGAAALPADLRVDLVNPGDVRAGEPAPAARAESARVAPRGRDAVPMPTRPVPRMITRAGWGADEAMVKGAPEYTGPIDEFFVHHTATGNGYDCADSARIVRGIQGYQVHTKGWDDIGYNFLVDKCGTIFEGRAGGVGRSVLGAHTLGFNTDASAIAVIGTYDSIGVTTRVQTAIAEVAAYKLGAFGNDPNGRVVVVSGGSNKYPAGTKATLYRISGHRDTAFTDCPGAGLESQLPRIRGIAGAAPQGLRLLRTSGAARFGRLWFTRGTFAPLWDVTTPSALIARFEVYVDGRLTVATPGTHRTTPISLTPGGHTVTIKALHLSGRSTTTTIPIVSDATAPVFTHDPEVTLRPGSLDGSVPIRLDWAATDVNGLSSVRLLRPTAVDLGTAAHFRNGTLRPGVPATFVVRATDRAGNAASADVTRTPTVLSETEATRTGNWRTLTDPAYLGGSALGSVAAGASATWTFTGRSMAVAATRSRDAGSVRIIVDGDDLGTVDLGDAKTVYRQAVWSHSWTISGEHTVRVELAGGGGAVLDGLAYLR